MPPQVGILAVKEGDRESLQLQGKFLLGQSEMGSKHKYD